MPKMKPDRDDSQGNMAGEGGPQDGPINGGDRHQRQDKGIDAGDTDGAGSQRHPGGSSRDSEKLG
jgi:hypothetical protein